jgi:hypothetical protein
MNKVGGAYKTIEPMDSATLHLPSDRDAYWGHSGLKRDARGDEGLIDQWRVLGGTKIRKGGYNVWGPKLYSASTSILKLRRYIHADDKGWGSMAPTHLWPRH